MTIDYYVGIIILYADFLTEPSVSYIWDKLRTYIERVQTIVYIYKKSHSSAIDC